MPRSPSKMHMYDMVKIDTIVYEIVEGLLKSPPAPPGIVSCLKHPGSDRVKPTYSCCRFENDDVITSQ